MTLNFALVGERVHFEHSLETENGCTLSDHQLKTEKEIDDLKTNMIILSKSLSDALIGLKETAKRYGEKNRMQLSITNNQAFSEHCDREADFMDGEIKREKWRNVRKTN